jgi:hypothetical protein
MHPDGHFVDVKQNEKMKIHYPEDTGNTEYYCVCVQEPFGRG